jgi:putative tryptophan/tyrosine transport system substrate-binding protein
MMQTQKFKIVNLAIALFVTLLPWLHLAEAQQPAKLLQLGILTFDVPRSEPFLEVFFQELRRLGYVEGQNIAFEFRSADGRVDRLSDLAAELVRLKVNVILASATGAALAAKNATSEIPIVFTAVSYPVGSGLVASLARPGGNITGLTNLTTDLSAKRLELLKEAFPGTSPVAVLSNPKDPISGPILQEVETAARALAVKLQLFEVRDPKEFGSALSGMTRARAGKLLVLTSQMFLRQRARIVDIAAKHRLPSMFWTAEFVTAGGLMSYGTNTPDLYRRAATYVDKILKGTKPADLPVEQPTKFEFIVNLKTAKQIGVTIPPNVLARADRVIK